MTSSAAITWVKVVSLQALARDAVEAAGPQPNSALYWHVLEGARLALGPDRLAYLSRDWAGDVLLRSIDGGWTFRNPPVHAYRTLEAAPCAI
jgi:hypothetical protein